jgi:hypothetical protein
LAGYVGFVKVLILFGAALASVLPQHGLLPLALLMTSLICFGDFLTLSVSVAVFLQALDL